MKINFFIITVLFNMTVFADPIWSGEYKLAAQKDIDILADRETEIWARVYFPYEMSKPAPLVILLHGNHGTCGYGENPRIDDSCEYTNKGTCPLGYKVTPNHLGYEYLAGKMVAQGMIVVSINANRGITCGGGVSGDFGLNLARGRLVLKHLQILSEWNKNGGSPKSGAITYLAVRGYEDYEPGIYWGIFATGFITGLVLQQKSLAYLFKSINAYNLVGAQTAANLNFKFGVVPDGGAVALTYSF
ncbi:hypothetical protein K2X05_03395 [bacterium]|nr:hypothetical protein [bacterium]